MDLSLIIFLAFFAILIFYIIAIFNKLVTLKNRFQNAFAQIEVQLKRRHDLIPNLVETAKGYIKHERETLEAVIQARNAAANSLKQVASDAANVGALENLMGAESKLSGALGQFNMLMEAYPDLKASQNMMQLTEELITTENRIAFARQAFNDQVMEYNTYRQSFPPTLFAAAFGHPNDATLLRFEDSEQIQKPPTVSF